MVTTFVCTALINLPVAIPCCILTFALTGWGLRQKQKNVVIFTKICFFLSLTATICGIIYGILRFTGMVMFTNDSCSSLYWFGTSWRDAGFHYVYGCGTLFVGTLAALFFGNKNGKHKLHPHNINGTLQSVKKLTPVNSEHTERVRPEQIAANFENTCEQSRRNPYLPS